MEVGDLARARSPIKARDKRRYKESEYIIVSIETDLRVVGEYMGKLSLEIVDKRVFNSVLVGVPEGLVQKVIFYEPAKKGVASNIQYNLLDAAGRATAEVAEPVQAGRQGRKRCCRARKRDRLTDRRYG